MSNSPQLDILVLGRQEFTSNFIRLFEGYTRVNEFPNSYEYLKKFLADSGNSQELPESRFTTSGLNLCFHDAQGASIKAINNTKIHLANRSLDVILLLLDCLDDVKFYEEHVFSQLKNFPSDNIIFVTLHDEEGNGFVVQRWLQQILEDSNSDITVALRKNLFLLIKKTFFYNTVWNKYETNLRYSIRFCENLLCYMKNLTKGQFNFKFSVNAASLLDVNNNLIKILHEILHCIENNLENIKTGNYITFIQTSDDKLKYTICKKCSVKKGRVYICHNPCDCQDNPDMLCSKLFSMSNACDYCHCEIGQHINTRYHATTDKQYGSERICQMEKTTMLYLLAACCTFKEHESTTKSLNETFWSSARLKTIEKGDALHKEMEANVKLFKLKDYNLTAEELATHIVDFTKYSYQSVKLHPDFIDKFLQPACELRLAAVQRVATQSNVELGVKPHNFPEMKSAIGTSKKAEFSVEDLQRDLSVTKSSVYKIINDMEESIKGVRLN